MPMMARLNSNRGYRRDSLARKCHGFTLAEIAIALVIVVLLLGGLLLPLTAHLELRNRNETNKTLAEVKEALVGFAAAKSCLPCPASTSSGGVESRSAGVCTNPLDGYVPATTLGVAPTDAQGYALDAWGNRLRYAVTKSNSNAFTTCPPATPNMPSVTLQVLSPNLKVCSAINADGTDCGSNATLANSAVAVIFSRGRNGGVAVGGTDENENTDPDAVFVSHEERPAGSPTGEFDDIVTWLSPNILYNRLISAGKLP